MRKGKKETAADNCALYPSPTQPEPPMARMSHTSQTHTNTHTKKPHFDLSTTSIVQYTARPLVDAAPLFLDKTAHHEEEMFDTQQQPQGEKTDTLYTKNLHLTPNQI